MTILTQKIGSGRTRVCNGTCHNAKTPKCKCICGGRYHGKASLAPLMLAHDWEGAWNEARQQAAAAGDVLAISGVVQDAINQLPLPFDVVAS